MNCIMCDSSEHNTNSCKENKDPEYTYIFEQTAAFVESVIEDDNILDIDVRNRVLIYLSNLRHVELYVLAKSIYGFRKENENSTNKEYLVDFLLKANCKDILRIRYERHAFQVTIYITSGTNMTDMYNRFIEEVYDGIYTPNDIIKCLEYGLSNYFFNRRTERDVMLILNRIISECIVSYTDLDGPFYKWSGDRRRVKPELTIHITSSDESYSCSVCYEDYPDSKSRGYLSKCEHSFCVCCIKQMTKNVSKLACPLCRVNSGVIHFVSQDAIDEYSNKNKPTAAELPTAAEDQVNILDFM